MPEAVLVNVVSVRGKVSSLVLSFLHLRMNDLLTKEKSKNLALHI